MRIFRAFEKTFSRSRPRGSVIAMARARKTGLALTGEVVPTRWEDHRRVVKLTTEIRQLQQRTARQFVEGIIEIGRRMIEIRDTLARGEFQRWIAEAMPFTTRTVNNYMLLAQWADQRPRDLERLGHLGPSKLYLLAPLQPGERRRLTSRTPVPIPGGDPKTIDAMTYGELKRAIGGGFTSSAGGVPIGTVVQRVQYGLAGLDANLDVLVGRADEIEPEVAEVMYGKLVELVGEFEAAFGF